MGRNRQVAPEGYKPFRDMSVEEKRGRDRLNAVECPTCGKLYLGKDMVGLVACGACGSHGKSK